MGEIAEVIGKRLRSVPLPIPTLNGGFAPLLSRYRPHCTAAHPVWLSATDEERGAPHQTMRGRTPKAWRHGKRTSRSLARSKISQAS